MFIIIPSIKDILNFRCQNIWWH